MEFIRNNRHKLTVKINSDELDKIDAFKKEMHYVLHDKIESSFWMIENHLDEHIYADAQCEELVKMRNVIIEGPSFNKFYASVVKLEYPSFEFPSNDLFYYFAFWSELLHDNQMAILRLKEYLELQCIEYLLKQYETNPVFKEQKLEFVKPANHFNSQYLNVFKPYGYELFEFLEKELEELEKKVTVRFSILFLFLRSKDYVKDNFKNYLQFIHDFRKNKLHDFNTNKNLKFNRIANIQYDTPKYIGHQKTLNVTLEHFEKQKKQMRSNA